MRRYRGPITDHFDGAYFYNPYYPSDPIQPPAALGSAPLAGHSKSWSMAALDRVNACPASS